MGQDRNDTITPVVRDKSMTHHVFGAAVQQFLHSTPYPSLSHHNRKTMPLQINTTAIHTKSIAARKMFVCFALRDNQWSSYNDLAFTWCNFHGKEPTFKNIIDADREVRNGKKAMIDHSCVDGLCSHDAAIDPEGCDTHDEHVVCVQSESRNKIAHRFRINPKVAESVFFEQPYDTVSVDGGNTKMDLDIDDDGAEDEADYGDNSGDDTSSAGELDPESDVEDDDSENEIMSLDNTNEGEGEEDPEYAPKDGTIILDDSSAESVSSVDDHFVDRLLDHEPDLGNDLGNDIEPPVEPARDGAWYQRVAGLVRSIQAEVGQMFAHFNGRQNQTQEQVVQLADQIATHDAQIRTLTQALENHTLAQKQNQTQNHQGQDRAPRHIARQDPQLSRSSMSWGSPTNYQLGTYYADIIKQCYGLSNVHANTILSENGDSLTRIMRPMGWLVGEEKTRCVNQQRLILPHHVDEFKMKLKEQFPIVVNQSRVHHWRETI